MNLAMNNTVYGQPFLVTVRYDYHNSEGHHFRWTALGSMDKYGRYINDADELDPYERSVNPEWR